MKNLLTGFLLLISLHLYAQENSEPNTDAVKSIDRIMKEVYSTLS